MTKTEESWLLLKGARYICMSDSEEAMLILLGAFRKPKIAGPSLCSVGDCFSTGMWSVPVNSISNWTRIHCDACAVRWARNRLGAT